MRRKLFNLATAMSLALSAAVCVVWVDSNFFSRKVSWRGDKAAGFITTDIGNMLLVTGPSSEFFGEGGWQYRVFPVPAWQRTFAQNCLWPVYARMQPNGTRPALSIPCWLLMVMTLALPGWRWAARHRSHIVRSRRLRSVLCAECGYDLRATPERCPECGTPATPRESSIVERA